MSHALDELKINELLYDSNFEAAVLDIEFQETKFHLLENEVLELIVALKSHLNLFKRRTD